MAVGYVGSSRLFGLVVFDPRVSQGFEFHKQLVPGIKPSAGPSPVDSRSDLGDIVVAS